MNHNLYRVCCCLSKLYGLDNPATDQDVKLVDTAGAEKINLNGATAGRCMGFGKILSSLDKILLRYF